MPRAFAIVDDLLSGLEAMHAVQIAHLDVKPPNVVLRKTPATRCSSTSVSPAATSAPVAAACTTAPPKFGAKTASASILALRRLREWLRRIGSDHRLGPVRRRLGRRSHRQHFTKQPAADQLARMELNRRFAPLAQLLRATLSRDPKRRRARRDFAPASKRSRTSSRSSLAAHALASGRLGHAKHLEPNGGSYRPRRPRCSTNETTLDRTVRLSLDRLRRRIRPGARSLRG